MMEDGLSESHAFVTEESAFDTTGFCAGSSLWWWDEFRYRWWAATVAVMAVKEGEK